MDTWMSVWPSQLLTRETTSAGEDSNISDAILHHCVICVAIKSNIYTIGMDRVNCTHQSIHPFSTSFSSALRVTGSLPI